MHYKFTQYNVINLLSERNPSIKWNASICVYENSYRNYVRKSSSFRDGRSVSHIVQRSIGDRISSIGRPIFSDWDARGLFNVCKIIRENICEKGLETTPILKRNANVDRRHRFISKEREWGAASRSRNEMTLFWDNNARANFSFFHAVCIISRLLTIHGAVCCLLDLLGNTHKLLNKC